MFSLNKITSLIPRPHLYAIGALVTFSIASMTLLPHPNELSLQTESKKITLAQEPLQDDANTDPKIAAANPGTEYVSISDKELLGDDNDVTDGLDKDAENGAAWTNYQVKSDDNLSVIFDTLNLSPSILQKLLSADKQDALVHLRIDQTLSFQIDKDNQLLKLSIPTNASQSIVYTLKDGQYVTSLMANTTLTQEQDDDDSPSTTTVSTPPSQNKASTKAPSRLMTGQIDGTFVNSAIEAGLTHKQVLRIVGMFKGRIDFRKDVQKGDQFKVLFDKNIDDSAKIVAVQLTLSGKDYRAFRYDDGQFYDETASNLTSGTFLRYPTTANFRLSSGFSPNRRNPVTGIVQPHNGTDFAVPIGTKVIATGDAIVVKAASTPSTGRYVVLRHNGKYSTVYMHMSKLLVRSGQRVKQGQAVGLSGNTGRSTGPHIHYEVRINNRPVNAMRVDLPMNDNLSAQKKRQFLAKVKQYSNDLN